MSSICSMPMLRDTWPSVTPVFSCSSGVSYECVVVAGWIACEWESLMLATW